MKPISRSDSLPSWYYVVMIFDANDEIIHRWKIINIGLNFKVMSDPMKKAKHHFVSRYRYTLAEGRGIQLSNLLSYYLSGLVVTATNNDNGVIKPFNWDRS